jgi:glycosyltransferase involved in cell wall biosynthesis
MAVVYRVAIVASHVIQYQAPFFRLLAQHPDLDVEVLYCSTDGAETYLDAEMKTTFRWDLDLLSGYRSRFLRNHGRGEGPARLINPAIVPAILRGRYDAVIFFLGWGTVTSMLGLAACRLADTPILLFGDSSFPPPPRFTRDLLLRTIFRMTHAFLVSGLVNTDYYRHYGADERRFFLVPWAVDNQRFIDASRFSPGEREALRESLGFLPADLVLVFSAKFIPRKDPMTLLRAMARMRNRARVAALFLGNGDLLAEMRAFVETHSLRAHFAGFINQSDLPKHYAAGDVFVLPTLDDPRGTVVNEAMACGLPILATDRLGAVGDIVRHEENGFVFAPGDDEALAAHLDRLIEDPVLLRKMAAQSRMLIEDWSYERGVIGVLEALRTTC